MSLPPALRPVALVAGLLAVLVALPVTANAAPKRGKAPTLSVMTRNIYLGGDISLPIGSQNRAEFEEKNQIVWDTIEKTNFPARAKLLAKEVKDTRPDLIGLQEVALWRKGPKNDPAAATDVAFDFLKLLRKQLAARGLRYRVGSVQKEANVEGPTVSDGDVRLTMRDVVLVKRRKGLKVTGKGGRQYKADIGVPTAVGPVTVKRGYTFVDASLQGRRFRFVNTHLEAFLAEPRLAQAKELVGKDGPTRVKRPVILVGDLNSDAKGDPNGEGDPAPYRTIIRGGFRDAWTQINPGKPGFACCLRQVDIDDPPPFPADHRIDHILTKPRLTGLKAVRVGLDPRNRTKSGLWPADHGGVVATFRLR